ncbi:flagellar hook protein FlgE [Litchfieldella xinjiangensis]|uniref:flagellar hook protein FlgE n=1 Tax=Litchfieldella xinjiangensis TaxID=1166948 RepID=UPI0005BB0A6C|nr:flagellar hook protein FlgE [Halomonas xinjiangensis]
MSFSQALSGLNAASSKLGVLGNNIANSQTVGFKSANTQFADVYAGSVGLGTRVSATLQNFKEGNLESTNRELDLAVSGQGFYRFQQNGEIVYSRNGQLSMTPDGFLENASGARIMGYGINADGQVQAGGQPQVLNVPADEMPANATTNVMTTVNLDSRMVAGKDTNTAQVNNGAEEIDYHYSNNFTVYDSLGNPRNITVYYEKAQEQAQDGAGRLAFSAQNGVLYYQDGADYFDGDGNGVAPEDVPAGLSAVMQGIPNTWNAKVAMDGTYKEANNFTVSFNSNGTLAAPAAGNMPGLNFTGAELGGDPDPLNFELNLAGSTQFGNTSTTSQLTQNGYTSGTLVGITIQSDGTVMRNYANEQQRPAGQIALAHFRNPEGLRTAGDNAWTASIDSGQELLGAPGTGIFGTVESGAVESSNVDMAGELVQMIVSQRAYQANSQTIKTQDELLQTAINLR